MRFIKLLLLINILSLLNCTKYPDHLPSKKYYKVYKGGLKVISKDCPELRRLIKEGQMRIHKDCEFDCLVFFDKELYLYFLTEKKKILSDLCVKTKKEVDVLFGFETLLSNFKDENRIVLLKMSPTSSPESLNSMTLGHLINPRDSVVINPNLEHFHF